MSRLYPCVYCTEDGRCKKYSDDKVTSWCVQSPCEDEKPSKADRFRAMSDEELARTLFDVSWAAWRNSSNGEGIWTEQDWLDWLRQECER